MASIGVVNVYRDPVQLLITSPDDLCQHYSPRSDSETLLKNPLRCFMAECVLLFPQIRTKYVLS